MLNAYEFLPETLRRLVTRGIVPGVNEKAPQEFAVVHLPIPIANDNPPWSQHSTPWRILVFSTDTLCARELKTAFRSAQALFRNSLASSRESWAPEPEGVDVPPSLGMGWIFALGAIVLTWLENANGW